MTWDGRTLEGSPCGGWHWWHIPSFSAYHPGVPIWWTNCTWEHPFVLIGCEDEELRDLFDGHMKVEDIPKNWEYIGPCSSFIYVESLKKEKENYHEFFGKVSELYQETLSEKFDLQVRVYELELELDYLQRTGSARQ